MSDVRLLGLFRHMAESRGDSTLPLTPFSFDASTNEFCINERRVYAPEFEPESIDTTDPDKDDIKISEALNSALYISTTFGGLVAGPKLHSFIEVQDDSVFRGTIGVMAGVYESRMTLKEDYVKFADNQDLNIFEPMAHIGFLAIGSEEFGARLQVPGNCACMGPELSGAYFEGRIEEGFAEYGLHNVDRWQQKAALYAGLGHLAYLANSAPPRQGVLL